MNRRQAILGSIAAAFTGPGLVASVEVAELRAAFDRVMEAYNKHTHYIGVAGPTSPWSPIYGYPMVEAVLAVQMESERSRRPARLETGATRKG